MTRAIVVAGAIRYTVSHDDRVPLGRRLGSLVHARVIDELTREPVEQGLVVEPAGSGLATPAAERGAKPRVAAGGLVGIVGNPSRVLPRLSAAAYELGLSVRGPGYVSQRVTGTIGPVATFPATFTPLDLGDLTLHREPVVIHGRTVRRRNGADPVTVPPTDVVPLAGTTITVTGIWRTMPQANVVAPPLAPDLVALEPPVYAPRTTALGVVHTIGLAPVVGADKTLELDVRAGDTRLRLSDRDGLAATNVLAIDEANADRTEAVRVTAVAGAISPLQPATVTLAFPLAHPHRRGTVARRINAAGPGADVPFAVDAIAGDTTVFVAAAGFAHGVAVEVAGGPAGPEYHRLLRYEAVSDADGHFRLPPLGRVAQVAVQAQHAPFASITVAISVNDTAREQRLDFVFA
jgi:hypothetical protein